MSHSISFVKLISELLKKSSAAAVNQLAFNDAGLRDYLSRTLGASPGELGSVLADPVFEATFGWKPAPEGFTLEHLSKSAKNHPNLLHPYLVQALDAPWSLRGSQVDSKDHPYRLAKTTTPYAHQLNAWNTLRSEGDTKSVIVTSGTGSGKTECFMIPILDSLVRECFPGTSASSLEKDLQKTQQLIGVRALFLYPLNALIKSQQERFSAWTGPFKDKIRFCLYNGETEESMKKINTQWTPQEILDRKTLRSSPPPILVTNATMLEYMLVRNCDSPIMANSNGTLKWIVLDEAHSYIGSQAAEISLLLRRVLVAFGVESKDVRFIATSATIGDPKGDAGKKLRQFIADLAGVEIEQVELVSGSRLVPELEPAKQTLAPLTLANLLYFKNNQKYADLYAAVQQSPTALAIRTCIIANPTPNVKSSKQIVAHLKKQGLPSLNTMELLEWMDVLTTTYNIRDDEKTPFLPIRLHLFHNVLGGLWACADKQCLHKVDKKGIIPNWSFGAIYTERREHCECGSPVYEIQSCDRCHKPHLQAIKERVDDSFYINSPTNKAQHDFHLDDQEDPCDDENEESQKPSSSTKTPCVISSHSNGSHTTVICKTSREILGMHADLNGNELHLQISTNDGCPHCHAIGKSGQPFSSAFLGAPFFLKHIAPTLLGHCNPLNSPQNRPFGGRRMITFTDSRQGTARLAASLQQDSERNTMRGVIYKKIAGNQTPVILKSSFDQLKLDVHELERLDQTNSFIKRTLDEKRKALQQATLASPVSFSSLALAIQSDSDFQLASDIMVDRKILPIEKVAELFILKEFFRRPTKGNSLETMGLVSVKYPKLDKIHTPSLGTALPPHLDTILKNMPDSRWQSFLKICLDYFVRDRYGLHLEDLSKHIGSQYYKSVVSSSGLKKDNSAPSFPRVIPWPSVNPGSKQSRLVKRCAQAVEVELSSPETVDFIQKLLAEAFSQLTIEGGVLSTLPEFNGGYFLSYTEMSFLVPETAWHIDNSRQLLDIEWNHDGPGHATALVMPNKLDDAATLFGKIETLRSRGAWSDLADLAKGGSAYYRTAEHSAQQTARILGEYEAGFKLGKINLLCCSTTMEMGVDIGGISAVAMSNVPPHPANYLQRAGRAGRRGEQQAISLTICKSNPHDQMVFAYPLWAFKTALPAPKIMLESIPIAQRHANSFLLSSYLSTTTPDSADKLDMEWWTTLTTPTSDSPETLFHKWLDERASTSGGPLEDSAICSGLTSILHKTALSANLSHAQILTEAKQSALSILASWHAERDSLEKLIKANPSFDKDPYSVSLQIQKRRLLGEYLLQELSSRGFLPSYGFPSRITSFNTTNHESQPPERTKCSQKQIASHKQAEFGPSRDCISALSEYAPGSKVVINGGLYESSGVTLNWHAPASAKDVNQLQSIKIAWNCESCGGSGTNSSSQNITTCPHCDTASPKLFKTVTYLAPAGFSVNFSQKVTTDLSKQSFIPTEQPWINIDTTWVALPTPILGYMRASSIGSAFFHTRGPDKNGYAICLHCGRAEPQAHPSHSDPKPFNAHDRLRGAGKGASKLCTGSDGTGYAIKRDLMLGHQIIVDVFEILLHDENNIPVRDAKTAYSLAVAIRGAVANIFGVRASEIQCSTRSCKSPDSTGRSIILYDKSCSGYCTAINDKIVDVLTVAAGILTCPVNCDAACHHCLISYDTRFETPNMNRKKALALLSAYKLSILTPSSED